MKQSLRLLTHRQPKPQRHGGLIDSDKIVGGYLDKLDAMPQKYAVVTSSRTSILRRAWQWLLAWIRVLTCG